MMQYVRCLNMSLHPTFTETLLLLTADDEEFHHDHFHGDDDDSSAAAAAAASSSGEYLPAVMHSLEMVPLKSFVVYNTAMLHLTSG